MRYSAKLLGWVAATSSLVASAIQIPGFSQETQYLRYPGLQLLESKPKAEKDWAEFSRSFPTATKRTHDSNQAAVKTDNDATILQIEGVLEVGDETLPDESLYDTHLFEGQSGQFVQIRLESDDFDTYLILLDPDGEQIAANDDGIGELNSTISVELPQDGTYQVVANAYDSSGQGEYRLTISEISASDYRQAVDVKAKESEADRLLEQGFQQFNRSQFQEALASWEQALELYQEIGDRAGEATTLYNLGTAYYPLSQYERAIDSLKQSLTIAREIEDRSIEGWALGNLGRIHHILGQYEQAIDLYQQQLTIAHEIDERSMQSLALSNLGIVYRDLGQYEHAIDLFEQSLVIFRETGDRSQEGSVLIRLGHSYQGLAQYEQAINLYQQGLAISLEVGNRLEEAISLASLGIVHSALGEYGQAIVYHQRYLAIIREIGAFEEEPIALANLGTEYLHLGQYERAVDFFEQSLEIYQEIGNRAGEGAVVGNLGVAYFELGQYEHAVEFFEQSLTIARGVGDRVRETNSLVNLGNIYNRLGQYRHAINFYNQSLIAAREIGHRTAEGLTLNNIGKLLNAQNQPELAIIFLKASVEVRESIRGDIQGLDTDLQQSFTDTVADDYRLLADLLLQQNRIVEAQRVLDLLKVQELDDYLQNLQRSPQTESGVDFWQVETDLLALYQTVLDQAAELNQLEAKPTDSRTATETQRLTELRAIRDDAESWFYHFLDDPTVIATVDQIRTGTRGRNLEPENFADLVNNLRQLPQRTAALYPLILEDRLELVLIMPDGPPLRYPIAVSSDELNQVIVEFGQALKSPRSQIKPLAQQLYGWLIDPLAQQLEQAGIESIIYAPDGALRYVPLAALHDGEQYLAQRFSINHITTASLTDINLEPNRQNRRLLAAACADCNFTIPVGDRRFTFADLPFTETEVQTLAQQFSEVDILLNQAFHPDAMAELPGYDIVHLATHAAFVTGSPDESFIVFGDGDTVNLRQIRRQWNLANAELVVLSACETAVGSAELGSGVEILGLGYQIEQAGAQATLASLWQVSDGGTQVLMNAFYGALNQGMTKTEALRQAQIALITEDFSAVGGERATLARVDETTGQPIQVADTLDHPYYWAPFILIGNGL